jgi:hypothetical protein
VVVEPAGVGVILFAISAMIVPRQIMNAARIIILRITPHSIGGNADITTPGTNFRPAAPDAGHHFGE